MKNPLPLLLLLLAAAASFAQGPNTPRADLISTGRDYFRGFCTSCHGGNLVDEENGIWTDEGKGSPGGTPPLANSDFFMGIRIRPAYIVINGLEQPITVNGLQYNGHMPAHGEETLNDFELASILTYIRAVLNDSTVVSCNAGNLDPDGFATCVKTPRSPSEIATDSIAVWEITAARNNITRLAAGRAADASFAPASRSFRVGGAGLHVFAVPAGLSGKATFRVMDAWGRTVWSTRVNGSDRAVRWNGAATSGRRVSPGMYVARFEGFARASRASGATR
jgi:mono/diheme cytochrome c family protein